MDSSVAVEEKSTQSAEKKLFDMRQLEKALDNDENELQSQLDELKQKLYDSEAKRLELISVNNQETFRVNSELTRVRKELEKSEAVRQTLENELASMKTIQMRERVAIQEKDRALIDVTRLAEGRSYF